MIKIVKKPLMLFSRSERGSVAVIVAFAIFVLILGAAIAIDMARAQILQSKIQSSLDASGLAAVASLSSKPADITEIEWVTIQTQRYFNVNFQSGYLGTGVITPTVELDSDGKTYILTALSAQSTTFMTIAGIDTMNVGAVSKVTHAMGGQGMELVLVLDNSTSMNTDQITGAPCMEPCSDSKLYAVKTATISLLDILYGADNDTAPGLYVGIVPFSQAVNIGTSHSNFLSADADGLPAITGKDWGPDGSWGGCVMARTSPNDVTDITPSDVGGGFDVFWFPPNPANNQADADALIAKYGYYTNTNPDRDEVPPLPQVFPAYGWRMDNPDGSFNSYYPYKPWIFSPTSQGPNLTCPQPVLPMSASKAAVIDTVWMLNARGDTLINEGAAWAWRMLSPKWRGLWGGDMDANSLPLNYNVSSSRKVVVLMSDGWNRFFEYNYTAYGWLENFVDTYTSIVLHDYDHLTGQLAVEDMMDAKTKTICDNMKANGIIIYTIGFGNEGPKYTPSGDIDNSTMNSAMLKYCASGEDHYFYAPTNEDLKKSFKQIANSLVNLRISK